MRHLFLLLAFLGAVAFACPNGTCGPCGPGQNAPGGYNKSTMGTLNYALNIMKLQNDPQIEMALQGYHMAVASMPRGLDTDAFKEGTFNREMFLKNSNKVKIAHAQADLFENIYKTLDDEQKRELHRLMAAHQYYMGGFGPKGNCGPNKPCASQNACPPKAQNCQCPGDGSCGCVAGQPCKCFGPQGCGCNCGPKPGCGPKGPGNSCPPNKNCPPQP